MNPIRRVLRRLFAASDRPAQIPAAAPVAPPPPDVDPTAPAQPAVGDGPLPPPVAPTIPVPPRRRFWHRWRPTPVEREARDAARGTFSGPAPEEPTVARMLQDLFAELSVTYRTDPVLYAARDQGRLAGHALEDATTALAVTMAETLAATTAGDAVEMTSPDPGDIGVWTAGARARAARADAERAVRDATQAVTVAERAVAAADGQAIDRVAMAAAVGLGPINAFLAAFDRARDRMGRAGLGVLGQPAVEDLVRAVVTPIELTPTAAGDEDGDDGSAPGLHAA